MSSKIPAWKNLCIALVLAAPLAACPGKEQETASGSEGSSGGGSESESSVGTMASTSGAPTTGGTLGGSEGGSTGTTTTTTTTSGDPSSTSATSAEGSSTGFSSSGSTGGTIPPELDAACMAACDKIFECVDQPPFPSVDVCKQNCAMGVEGADCIAASVEFNTCLGTLTCPQIIDALMNEQLGPCTDALDALQTACAACEGFGSVGMGGCSVGQQCPDMPPVEYQCEGNTCTCLVDGMPTGMTCPANGVCNQGGDAVTMAANECCGFML